jgi:hypothetical protein
MIPNGPELHMARNAINMCAQDAADTYTMRVKSITVRTAMTS